MKLLETIKSKFRTPTKNSSIEIDLSWVDEFIENVKSYIYVRIEDNLLIKRPNNAQKLNPTGAKILKTLLEGKSINQLLEQIGRDPQKTQDIANFLYAIKSQLEGNLDRFTLNPAVNVEYFDMHFSDYPVLSEVAITYRCNLKCKFCYAGCNLTTNPISNNSEMTIEEIKKILWKIYHQAKVPSTSFTGGEPTLVPQLPELIRYAKNLGMRVNLITNGTLIDKNLAKKLSENGLDSAQVSLEGITAETHDKIVQNRGAFVKTVQGIKNLKDVGILTHTNTTITKSNLHEIHLFPKFVKQQFGNDKFSMNLIIPTGSAAINEELLVYYTEIGEYLQKIIEESKNEDVEFMWYSPVPMCMFNSIVYGLGNKGCSACDGLISIAPNGDVIPCASFDDSVGNLLKTEFDEIWHSAKALNYREKKLAHPKCKECEYFHICNGACPLYWRQVGFGELESLFSTNNLEGFFGNNANNHK